MRNKILSISLVTISIGVATWGVVYAVEILGGNTDSNPADPIPSNTIITIPESYEPKETEPLIIESKRQEEEKRLSELLKWSNIEKYINGEVDTYYSTELGISFVYPRGIVIDSTTTKGTTGKLLSGHFESREGIVIIFGGVTEDYRYPRGGSITNTLGYEKRGNDYFLKFIWGATKVVPSEFISINNGDDIAIVIKNTEIGQILNEKQIAAFVNTSNDSFPGFVFVISSQDGVLTDQDIKMFNDIIFSIHITK